MIVAGAVKLLSPAKGAGGGGPAASSGGPGGGGGAGGGRGGRGMPSQVTLIAVKPHVFTDTLDVIGVAKGRQSVTLSAATTQLVSRVLFTPGQTVTRGQVLVELKSSEQDAGLLQSQAKLVQAERAYLRWKSLAEKGFASKAAVDQYEAAWLSAKADVTAAQARQGDRMIRAPFSGVVGLSDIAPGAVINPGAAIVTLDDLSAIRVDFQVPDRFLSAVRQGQAVTATVDSYPGLEVHGVIARLDTRIDERTRALTARAEFPNPSQALKPGMMLHVAIAKGDRTGLAAPETAVSVQGDNAFVFAAQKVGQKMMADQRIVVTGVRQDGLVEIREGLAAGDMIVADGLNKVQPGQPIRPVGKGGGRPGAGAPSGAGGPQGAQGASRPAQ
ncbi:MAG: efflux transporter periplasmic adaptor subunit [Alphaproteobacteria bacterium PA2]|nr:MAG: efflux transporter periplasmic adaptor subunit [Alphaproteobacteria bacterium PA2]